MKLGASSWSGLDRPAISHLLRSFGATEEAFLHTVERCLRAWDAVEDRHLLPADHLAALEAHWRRVPILSAVR